MDLSLEDIIKKSKLGKRKQITRGQVSNGKNTDRMNRPANNKWLMTTSSNRPNLNRSLQNSNKTHQNIKDARLKIIQNKRKNIADARDKISATTRPTDARNKLLKLKESNWKRPRPTALSSARVTSMKHNTLKARIPNPTRHNGQKLPNNNMIRNGREFNRRNNMHNSFSLKRSINNDLSKIGAQAFTSHRGQNDVLLRTINNQQRMSEIDFPINSQQRMFDMDFSPKINHPSSIKVVMQNDSAPFVQRQQREMDMEVDYGDYLKPSPRTNTSFSDERLNHRGMGGRISQEMMARLDTAPPAPQSMGIFSSPAAQPMSMNVDIGHRIVVSNLQSSVTHEDIKELFEDIGPLLASRVVRPGTAEVIYNFQKDAKKAVEAYHNRQLDGQPMKCMLVNPRPLPMNTNPVGGLRPPGQQKIPSSSKSSVMPDINAIHKALFSK